MECNKDEAVRAKDIAVRKFSEKDFNGAKKFASKAKSLYPDLEGISQFLQVVDVHISAESRINGQMNWYGILGATPKDDEDTIKKQYRKLALSLHPDKNKAPGADAAFQFVLDAYGVLSDKSKKSAYDQRVNFRPPPVVRMPEHIKVPTMPPKCSQFQPKFPPKDKMAAPSPSANLFQKKGSGDGTTHNHQAKISVSAQSASENGHNKSASHHKPASNRKSASHHKSAGSSGSVASAPSGENMQGSSSSQMTPIPTAASTRDRNSFWTSCTMCKMQYEYLREFLNKTLLCPHCQNAFRAVETAPPSNLSSAPKWQQPQQQPQKPQSSARAQSSKGHASSNNHFYPHQGSGLSSLAFANGTGSDSTGNEQLKRSNADVLDGAASSKRRMVQDEKLSWNSFSNFANPFASVNSGTAGGIPSTYAPTSSYRTGINGELSQVETRKMLLHKAAAEVGKTVSGWKLELEAKAAARENRKAKEESYIDPSALVTEEVPAQTVSMDVPDSYFHDFDADRTEFCFHDNDVWAAYDTDDGMPRFYALVHEVISSKPFKMRISWLNSKSNAEFGPVEWVSQGFTKTCGEFRIGKLEKNESLNSFSHKVVWVKGPRGIIRIYPRKGEIWALFKNWSPDWNEETPDEVRHVYEMVEVVENYTEDRGVVVVPLMKAPDFQTVFHRQLDGRNLKRIPKEEMFRFSHHVPRRLLTADQVPGFPGGGCIELDPAATPTELL
ncbi:DnaJ homolog subfamily B member 14-like protein [Drosera capensis]